MHIARHICKLNSDAGDADAVFIDDGIRIQKYYEELRSSLKIGNANINTSGSVMVGINGNRDGNGHTHMTLLYFSVDWLGSFSVSLSIEVLS